MLKLFALMFILVGTVFAGALVTAVLATPSLADRGMMMIPVVAGLGAVLAVPFAYILAKRLVAMRA